MVEKRMKKKMKRAKLAHGDMHHRWCEGEHEVQYLGSDGSPF